MLLNNTPSNKSLDVRANAIPASLIVTGAFIGAVSNTLVSMPASADRMLDDFSYLIYLLPLALIIPILVKGIVDRKTEATSK